MEARLYMQHLPLARQIRRILDANQRFAGMDMEGRVWTQKEDSEGADTDYLWVETLDVYNATEIRIYTDATSEHITTMEFPNLGMATVTAIAQNLAAAANYNPSN